ncbi:MAG: HAMP domain-containing histidine kinase [Gaiella sp.]|nr:HAMP domain-containing histidine kinase [Gaiella sp.]
MPGSLRFRLPAVFLLGIVIAGLVSALIAVQLVSAYTRNQSYDELSREARGIARLYSDAALRAAEEGTPAPDFAPGALELATGDQLFYVGAPAFPGQDSGLDRIPESAVPAPVLSSNAPLRFRFRPPGTTQTYLAVSQPLRLEKDGPVLGAILVAKRQDVVRDQWAPLVGRLAAAFAIGGLLAWVLGVWLSRRISAPVEALAKASDEIARGNYAVHVPVGRGGDEISHLSERFNEMAARLAATEERERQFLMSVSHELRTPLTAIRGHVDALRDGLIDDPQLVGASLEVVANEATRLERLVGDVLDLAKLRAHRFTVQTEEVDMGRLVEHAYGSFGDEARRREIDYELVEPVAAPTIITDGDRVLQVITNLLKNAFRWTPDGGSIDVVLAAANGTVRVDVVDTGPGIPPEDVQRIFSPFVSRDTQGTGLGLPIAQELAAALGGRVEVDTEPGRGSRFRLVLPARGA